MIWDKDKVCKALQEIAEGLRQLAVKMLDSSICVQKSREKYLRQEVLRRNLQRNKLSGESPWEN